MRAVVQRVKKSSVEVEGRVIAEIGFGLNVLVGISIEDNYEDLIYLKDKILNLRIFDDEFGKMNYSLKDVQGELLIVSQFTLYGDGRRGRRPNFMEALSGDKALNLYEKFISLCGSEVNNVKTGAFGANMEVNIQNDGPVTILLDSKKTF